MHFDWVGEAAIYVTMDENGAWIRANRDGLRSLANFLATLAEEEARGAHFHLGDYSGLEEGSLELLAELVEAQDVRLPRAMPHDGVQTG